MSSALIADALSSVWCAPDPHNQVILQPARITPNGGVTNSLVIGWINHTLPNLTSRFHVYQIGQIAPVLVELMSATTGWQTLAEACNDSNVICDIYTASGIQIPRTRTYYMYTKDKNIVLAVEKNPLLNYGFDTDIVYFRAYRNSFYSNAALSAGKRVNVQGGLMSSISTITSLQIQISNVVGGSGYSGGLYIFINGYKKPTINISTVKVGDVAEFVYDPSIYKVADFAISSLPTFVSTLDSISKYLLHYTGSSDGYVDYVGNIDIFMIDVTTQMGVYVNKNTEKTLRQVTFKDYSIPTTYLPGYYSNFTTASGSYILSNLYLRLHIRYSGNELAPIADANLTNYLMKLSDSQIVGAMVGGNASLPMWTAAALENSAYTKLMRSNFNQIDHTLVESAYGYATTNLRISPSVQTAMSASGTMQVTVPTAMVGQCTAFEYDASGVLLGYSVVAANTLTYICVNANAHCIEFVSGIGGVQLDETYGMVNTTLSSSNTYHYYVYTSGAYHDVSGLGYNTVTNGVSSWNSPSSIVMSNEIVRSDKKFLLYTATMNPTDGLLIHQLNYTQNTLTGQHAGVTLPVPLGELDLWLNGHELVPGIDYIYKFPTISIISKTYLVNTPGAQVLTVRYSGFCDTNFKQLAYEEVGFTYNGLLSADTRYHLHEQKVQRICVGGVFIPQGSAAFAETTRTPAFSNGVPYRIRDVINPLSGYVAQDPYVYYSASKAAAKSVSDYLSTYLPQTLPSPINTIVAKRELYSPFIGKIVSDLANGILVNPVLATQYADSVVTTICAAYAYLLALDPISYTNTPNLDYCTIEPTWLSTTTHLTADQFRFVNNVARIYANGIVNLSPLISV